MILDLQGKITTTVHKICISNYAKDRFITTMPSLQWTDNFNLACCFNSELEVIEFVENNTVQKILENTLELYIWTDTKQSIHEFLK